MEIDFKALRQAKGLSVNDVAEKMDITVASVYRIENGTHKPTFENVIKYLNAVDLELEIKALK